MKRQQADLTERPQEPTGPAQSSSCHPVWSTPGLQL